MRRVADKQIVMLYMTCLVWGVLVAMVALSHTATDY
jgi:hypothetical protein